MKAHVAYVMENEAHLQQGDYIEGLVVFVAGINRPIDADAFERNGPTLYLITDDGDCIPVALSEVVSIAFVWSEEAKKEGVRTPVDLVKLLKKGKLS